VFGAAWARAYSSPYGNRYGSAPSPERGATAPPASSTSVPGVAIASAKQTGVLDAQRRDLQADLDGGVVAGRGREQPRLGVGERDEPVERGRALGRSGRRVGRRHDPQVGRGHATTGLFYQPIYDLARSAPYGVEALLRWEEPERGMVSPGEFIPVAEQTGAIVQLGIWVLEELCRHARGWRAHGIALRLHFNVSALELRRCGFASSVLSIIRSQTLDPASFTLEVTESTAVLATDRALPAVHELRAAGMQIAIDDFGAGHSSLSRLNELPADMLKIDRALVAGLPASRTSKALVGAALDIARALDLGVVAEGIESDAQRRVVADAGCLLGQGFHLGRPRAAERDHLPAWTGDTSRT
jgi:EAL domain-containing protein (putative c-di-GMP-specific phosphodiesterase class I)